MATRVGCETYVARQQYRCDFCNQLIFPSDLYERNVTLHRNDRYKCILVTRKHLNPDCPFEEPTHDDNEEGCADETHPEVTFLMAA